MIFYEGAVSDNKPEAPKTIQFRFSALLPVFWVAIIGASFEVSLFSKTFRKINNHFLDPIFHLKY